MPKRVLVCDDHSPTRALIRALLEAEKNQSFDIVEAATGGDCIQSFDGQGPFDLVLLDVGLPDMDGYTVCRALRRVDNRVPIVFVTGQGELKDFNAGRAAGADSYLVKPIARAALKSITALFTSMERRSGAPDPEPAQK
jgi:CheY-like chemotaxis protein